MAATEDMEHQKALESQDRDTSYVCGECFQLFTSMEYFNYHQCTSVKNSAINEHQEINYIPDSLTSLDERDYGGAESEAAMEEAVASILGEKMKQMDPQRNLCPLAAYDEPIVEVCPDQHTDSSIKDMHVDENVMEEGSYQSEDHMNTFVKFEGDKVTASPCQYAEQSIEHMSIVDHSAEPVVEHLVEDIEPTVGNAEEMQIGPGMIVESVEIPSSNVYIYDNPVYLNRLMKDNTCGKRVRHDAPYIHRLGPWDDKSSQILIQLLREYPEAYFILGKNCKRTEAWELIRYKLVEAGYHFTVLQIRMRWRELCKRYRNIVNHNELHENKRSCQYFDELNDLFGIWDSQATQLLIQQFGTNSAKRLGQNGGTRMRYKAWEQVRESLSKHGYKYTADQVYGRWSALVTLYRRMIEHNSDANNELMTVAYQDAIESVYKYVPERKTKLAKIREKHGQSSKIFKKKWTLPVERILLRGYKENIELFIENGNKKEIWEQIVKLLEEGGYHTTTEKVKARFCELSKQYEAMLHHNSQPGTLYRESRHHEILADIYNHHNCWPHDGSTMKSDNFSSLRMRQMKAQIMWSNDESRAVLTLYPQVLIDHLRNGDQPPLEELWVQLAKDLFSTYNFFKQPYEIEEHIALLRQGYKRQNPFSFRAEMEFLEETEHTLCFSPESPSTLISHLVPYWSHSAAHCLLDLIIHYCQEGAKLLTENTFNIISDEMENLGYRYTAEECRQYYYLLKKIYKKKAEALKKDREVYKLYPYTDKMNELRTVISQAEFTETDDVYLKIISAASSTIEEFQEADEESRCESMETFLLKLKMHLMHVIHIRPPPPVKAIALILLKFLKREKDISMLNDGTDVKKLTAILHPHIDILTLISQNGLQQLYRESQTQPGAVKRRKKRGEMLLKSASIQWTNDNICIMLNAVKEWQLLCHDDAELTDSRAADQPLWNEVAYKLSRRFRKCPNACQTFFVSMFHDYARLKLSKGITTTASSIWCKNQKVQDLLHSVLEPLGSHDAEWDTRDAWWAGEAGGWSQDETLELLFTVRELWSGELKMDWQLISLMMNAGGYHREAKCCYNKFHQLYSGYQRAFTYNQKCSIRERRRPPFYFKIHSLFGYRDHVPRYHSEPKTSREKNLDIDEQEVIEVLLAGLKDMKNFACHSVPRQPLLLALAQFLDSQYQPLSPTFTPYQIWHLLVQLHCAQRETFQKGTEGPFGPDIDGLWQNHPNPLVAYGFHAVPLPGWQSVSDWSMEELNILVKTSVECEINPSEDRTVGKAISEALQTEGYDRNVSSCQKQWQYMTNVRRHGGYQQYKDQINLVHLLQTELFRKQPSSWNQKEKKNILCEQESLYKKTEDGALEYEKSNEISKLTDNTVLQKFRVQPGKSPYQYPNISEKNRIRVEVLSVTETENSKVVECIAKEVQPNEIIKLHYPLTHSLPANIKYINIPRMLVYPAYVAPTGLNFSKLRTRENNSAPSNSLSELKLKNKWKVTQKNYEEHSTMQAQQSFRESSRDQQKRELCKSSARRVKTHQRISSLLWLKKRESLRMKLKRLRRGSQLQLKKSREVSKLSLKKRPGETLKGHLRNSILEPQELALKKRIQESSGSSVRRPRESSQVQMKNAGCSSHVRVYKNKQDFPKVHIKSKQKDLVQLPLKKRTNESSHKQLELFSPQMKSTKKYFPSRKKHDTTDSTYDQCYVAKVSSEEGEIKSNGKIEEQQRRNMIDLIKQYHCHFKQEKDRLLNAFQESRQQELLALECILSLIQEITHFSSVSLL